MLPGEERVPTDRSGQSRLIVRVLAVAYTTFLIVCIGVWFGYDFLTRREYNHFPGFMIHQPNSTFVNSFANWDGVWYADIARDGYQYDPQQGSHVVFFPLYPLCGWVLSQLTGWHVVVSLLVVSQTLSVINVWLLGDYIRRRYCDANEAMVDAALLGLALLPGTLWFRMAYSDGLFLTFVLLFLGSVQRKLPLWVMAVFSGGATGTRTVGIALAIVWAFVVWSRQQEATGESRWSLRVLARTVGVGVLLGPVCLWGLLAFMLHLWWVFGDPLIFQSNQALYNDAVRMAAPWSQRCFDLLTLEPLWSVFVPGTNRYWLTYEPVANPLFVLRFVNVPYFTATALLIGYGAWKGWLNATEFWVGALLLLIPYVTKGYDNAMLGHARYAAVAAPVYLVVGRLLCQWPPLVGQLLFSLSAVLLAFYSALFAAWYIFI